MNFLYKTSLWLCIPLREVKAVKVIRKIFFNFEYYITSFFVKAKAKFVDYYLVAKVYLILLRVACWKNFLLVSMLNV